MTNHIKIYGVKPRIQYVSNGNLKKYEFPFVIFKTSDVDVYLDDKLLTTSEYEVSVDPDIEGGAISFKVAPSNGTVITIARNLSIERTTDFQEGGALRANVLNDELDYQIACQQQIADSLNRSMVLPPYAVDTDVDLTLPTPSAGKAIVWNADGTNLENSEVKVNELSRELDIKLATATEQADMAISAAQTATQQAIIASEQVSEATIQADRASEQATLATQKAEETTNALSTRANTDMNNLTAAGKQVIANLGMPDYTAGVSYAGNTWIKAPYDCYVIGGLESGSSKETQIQVNARATESDYVVLRRIYGYANVQGAFIRKGFYFRLYCNGTTYNTLYFPLVGVK